jgi:hypothetical protein
MHRELAPKLAYAIDCPIQRRQRWTKRIALLALAVAATAVVTTRAFHWSLPYYRQWNVLDEQRYLTDFNPPEGTVALTNVPAECSRLFPTGKYVIVSVKDAPFSSDRGFCGFMPAGVPIAANGGSPTLFLHSCRSPAGNERVVHVTLDIWGSILAWEKAIPFMRADEAAVPVNRDYPYAYFTRLVFQDEIYQPATRQVGSTFRLAGSGSARVWPDLTSFLVPHVADPRNRPRRQTPGADFNEIWSDDPVVRIWVGRPDPKDPARFEIPYECDGHSGVVEGQLRDDDSIGWNIVSGPLHRWP